MINLETLRKQKFQIKPISKAGGWLEPGHDGHFMFTNALGRITVPMVTNGNGILKDPLAELTDAQKIGLAKEIGVSPDDFNIYKKVNYFSKYEVKLNKEVKELDLSIPHHLIDYLVLRTNPDKVQAHDIEANPTQKWKVIDRAQEIIDINKAGDTKIKAMSILSNIASSSDKMANFLLVVGKTNVPTNATKDWLFAECYKQVEANPANFIKVFEDENFDIKMFILNALKVKALIKTGKDEYKMASSDKLLGSMRETMDYFKNDENSADYLLIETQIKRTIN